LGEQKMLYKEMKEGGDNLSKRKGGIGEGKNT